MSAAAKELYISQPSLSNAIKQLEDELNIQIFERTHWGVTATSDGIDLIKRAEAIVSSFNALENRYKQKNDIKKKLKIVTMPCLQSGEAFKKICCQYSDAHNYDFSYFTTTGNKILHSIASNDADIGIAYFSQFQMEEYRAKVEYHALEFIPITILKTYICINAKDPLAQKLQITVDDLMDYAIVCNRTSMFLDTVNILFKSIDSSVDVTQYQKIISTNSKRINYELLKYVKAFSLGTSLDVHDYKELNVMCIPTDKNFNLTLGYIKRKNKSLSFLSEQYLKILGEYLVKINN